MKIKCLLIKPGEKVKVERIPANIKFVKSLIGNRLIRIKLEENAIILANKDASKVDFNRILGDKIINGAFLVVGIKDSRRVSLKKKQIRKYSNLFKLEKHEKRINKYKDSLLNMYYTGISEVKKGKHEYDYEAMEKAA